MRAERKRHITAWALAGVVAGMVGMSFAAVPLYKVFCEATGLGGTTRRVAKAPANAGEVVETRMITVRFDATVNSRLPWTFEPVEREMRVRIGEPTLAFYRAHNFANTAVSGSATFNVNPSTAGVYFNKIACFCFEAQTLAAGETVDMPVSFFVDPAILKDADLKDIEAIVLSYTFFRNDGGSAAPAVSAVAPASTAN
ncbi:MAG: cytochrome c oxidase assembly protein [Alphaproteobacteria bacterium]